MLSLPPSLSEDCAAVPTLGKASHSAPRVVAAAQAPDCTKEQKFETYFGRKIAVDASMHIYQFMVVVRSSAAARLRQHSHQNSKGCSASFACALLAPHQNLAANLLPTCGLCTCCSECCVRACVRRCVHECAQASGWAPACRATCLTSLSERT